MIDEVLGWGDWKGDWGEGLGKGNGIARRTGVINEILATLL